MDFNMFSPPKAVVTEALNKDDFCYRKIDTYRGSVLTPVGWDVRIGSHKHYIFTCSICSKDSVLWPLGSIKSTAKDINRGYIPCGCSKKPSWKPWQYKIKAERACLNNGWVFEGFSEWCGVNTKVSLYNPKTQNRWDTGRLSGLLTGRGDPSERKVHAVDNQCCSWDYEKHIKAFMLTGAFKDGVIFSKDITTRNSQGALVYWRYRCPVCSADEYVASGVCDGIFTSTQGRLKAARLACRCSTHYHWTQEQREYQIKKLLTGEFSGSFIGWEHGSYQNANSLFKWSCIKGHTVTTSVSSFISSGTRCPSCAAYGFSPEKSAWFYIVRWYGFGESFLKYGITNHEDYTKRLRQQASLSKLDHKVLNVTYYNSGSTAILVEKRVKMEIASSCCPKEWLPDGYTETVEDTIENFEKILKISQELLDIGQHIS